MPAASKSRLVVVKRYSRSRLYDTTHSRYVSMRVAFCVIDAEDGADITRILLA
jgi:polyhydroxyalkanoate synthesis regulator protein